MKKVIVGIIFLMLLGDANRALSDEVSSNPIEPYQKPSNEVPPQTNLVLGLGVSKTESYNFDIGPIEVTDPSLFDYTRIREGNTERKLLFIPKNPGQTDMTIRDTKGDARVKYMVSVAREDLGELEKKLKKLLGDIEGLKIVPLEDRILLDGEVLLPKDEIRIMKVIDALKDRDSRKKEVPIKNLTSISKLTMNILAQRIERDIGSPEISVQVKNNNIVIEGLVDSEYEAKKAIEIAKTYLPEVYVEKTRGEGGEVRPKAEGGTGGGLPTIIDFMQLRSKPAPSPSQDIKITMNYVEFNNDYNRTFNFTWAPLNNDQSNLTYNSNSGVAGTLIGTVSSLFPSLSFQRDHGHAKILRTQSIIIKDRAETFASIDSSTTYYISMPGFGGYPQMIPVPVQNVTKVKAAILKGTDSIDLGLQINLGSMLGSTNGAPIIANNSIQTQVIIKNGDSAALGGTAVEQALAGYNRNPSASGSSSSSQSSGGSSGGGNGLFNLSRSKSLTHNKSQHVIFITPEIIPTAKAGTEDIVKKFRLNSGER